MSLEDMFRQLNDMLNQMLPLMVLVLAVALVSAVLARERARTAKEKAARPKTAGEAVKEVLSHEGYVLLTVDPGMCGYCEAAKIMLDTKGIPYKEVNITEVPEDELEELVNTLGIEHVPVLLLVKDGKVILRKHFSGKKEKDIPWVRKLEVYA